MLKMRLVEGKWSLRAVERRRPEKKKKKKKTHASSVCLFSDDGVDPGCVCSTCLAFISLTAVCLLHIV